MRRKRECFLLAVVVLLLAIIAWAHRAPDVEEWPRFRYFRCINCGCPASVNPYLPKQWGCQACGFGTFQIIDRFRVAKRADIPQREDRWEAWLAAGGGKLTDEQLATPMSIWLEAGGYY